MDLTTTSQIIRAVTDSLATLSVVASWTDRNGSTITPGNTWTSIATATTTTIVAAPGASTSRRIKSIRIRNNHASLSSTIRVEAFDSSTAFPLDSRVLGPGQSIVINENGEVVAPSTGGPLTRPWYGLVAGAHSDGSPEQLLRDVQKAGNVAATPTNIGTSVARCSGFMLPFDLTVNRIRAFGVGATTGVYRVAIYRMSDLARLTAELSFNTAVDTWVSIGSALNVALAKDTPYFVACAVNATGTTAGLVCHSGTVAATTGRINTTPANLPGNLASGAAKLAGYHFQFAVTTGALPNPSAALAAQAAWAGGMPALWLDNSDT